MNLFFKTKTSKTKASMLSLTLAVAGLVVATPAIAQTDMQTDMPANATEDMADPMGASESMSEPMNSSMSEDASSSTIVDLASSSGKFNTLVQAVEAADLTATLSEPGPYTVFAPTDEAFAQLPAGALDYLLEPENEDLLKQVLTYHVVPGEVTSDGLYTGGISALSGGLAVGVYDSGVVINNASVTEADMQASNGVVHEVNRVLIPEALQQQLATRLGVSRLYQ